MRKKSAVWFREQTGYYYTAIRRKQIRLPKDKAEADRMCHALMAQERPAEKAAAGTSPTFRKLADL